MIHYVDSYVDNRSINMISLPGGEFKMSCSLNPGDMRDVKVSPFSISPMIITYKFIDIMMEAIENMSIDLPEVSNDEYPILVPWLAAVWFCNCLSEKCGLHKCYTHNPGFGWDINFDSNGYRLPTEAEWEYALKAQTKTTFYWGNDENLLKEYAWIKSNSNGKYHPVGKMKPNPFGLYDMYGNCWEWCNDAFIEDLSTLDYMNPFTQGANDTIPKVIRGGDYKSESDRISSWFRDNADPVFSYHGFRIVCRSNYIAKNKYHAIKNFDELINANKVNSSLRPLILDLKNSNHYLREEAVKKLESFKWNPSNDEIGVYYWIAKLDWAKCIEIGDCAVIPLIDILFNDNTPYKSKGNLFTTICDMHAEITSDAAESLGKLGQVALNPIIEAMQNSKSIPHASFNSLVMIGGTKAEDLCKEYLHNSESYKHVAAKSLEKLEWEPTRDEVGALYCVMMKKWDCCLEMGEVAIMPLINALKFGHGGYSDDYIREINNPICNVLYKIGDKSIFPLIEALECILNKGDRFYIQFQIILELLLKFDDPRILTFLHKVFNNNLNLQKKITNNDYHIVHALGKIGNAETTECLIIGLKVWRSDRKMVETIAKTLEQISDAKALITLKILNSNNLYYKMIRFVKKYPQL